eukprot:CCRYP_002228-RA/>CCRYP_002228-RA protein AED:0.45 eAED:0.51 QI:0/0/0.5/1/0/0/2/898/101
MTRSSPIVVCRGGRHFRKYRESLALIPAISGKQRSYRRSFVPTSLDDGLRSETYRLMLNLLSHSIARSLILREHVFDSLLPNRAALESMQLPSSPADGKAR